MKKFIFFDIKTKFIEFIECLSAGDYFVIIFVHTH